MSDRDTRQVDRAFTGRIGATYRTRSGVAPYLSYSTSYEPTLGTDAYAVPFKPTLARQFEGGVKYDPSWFDGFVTVSAFDIRQRNVTTTDPLHPTYSIQRGEARSRGVEFEAHAHPTKAIDIIAAYTYLDTTIRQDSKPALVGRRLVAVPEHVASVWADYSFHDNQLPGITVGGGVRYVGRSAGDPLNSFFTPGRTLIDAALRWDVGRTAPSLRGLKAAVNVSNFSTGRSLTLVSPARAASMETGGS